MPKYQVLEGSHYHDGRLHGKGDVIQTNVDLIAQFPNKFLKVGDSTPPTNSPAPLVLGPAGSHGVDESKLPPKDLALTSEKPKPEKKGATKSEAPKGKDVTDKFPDAAEEDFKVFKNEGQYFVYDADDLSQPKNEQGVDKAGVAGVVKKALEK